MKYVSIGYSEQLPTKIIRELVVTGPEDDTQCNGSWLQTKQSQTKQSGYTLIHSTGVLLIVGFQHWIQLFTVKNDFNYIYTL